MSGTGDELDLAALARAINVEHRLYVHGDGDCGDRVLRIGEMLWQARTEVKARWGKWMPWVEANCEFSPREARYYMQVFSENAHNPEQAGNAVSHPFSLRARLRAIAKKRKQGEASESIEQPGESSSLGIFGSLKDIIDRGELFSTIYADPPWRYGNQSTRAATDNHYRTMTVEQICAEPVRNIVAENAHLHLWTTNAFLRDAFDVIYAWGFEYKSCFVWVKPQMGIGNYWRVSHEFLLFGVRGKCPFRTRDEMSWGEFDRGKHSTKPDEVRRAIERVSPAPYLEMYGREAHVEAAWSVYGNQVQRRLA